MVKLHVLVCDMEEKVLESAKKVRSRPGNRLHIGYPRCLRSVLGRAQNRSLNQKTIRQRVE